MSDQKGPETLTITLTGRAPVRVTKADWPIVATAYDRDGHPGNEPNRTYRMTVRQHADGRAIVYAVFTTALTHESDRRRGVLLSPGEDIGAALHLVAQQMAQDGDAAGWHALAEQCVADLPAEVL